MYHFLFSNFKTVSDRFNFFSSCLQKLFLGAKVNNSTTTLLNWTQNEFPAIEIITQYIQYGRNMTLNHTRNELFPVI